jgi:hypothetical protein
MKQGCEAWRKPCVDVIAWKRSFWLAPTSTSYSMKPMLVFPQLIVRLPISLRSWRRCRDRLRQIAGRSNRWRMPMVLTASIAQIPSHCRQHPLGWRWHTPPSWRDRIASCGANHAVHVTARKRFHRGADNRPLAGRTSHAGRAISCHSSNLRQPAFPGHGSAMPTPRQKAMPIVDGKAIGGRATSLAHAQLSVGACGRSSSLVMFRHQDAMRRRPTAGQDNSRRPSDRQSRTSQNRRFAVRCHIFP